MINRIKRFLPYLFSGMFGFFIALSIFMPKAYSSNRNVYRVLQDKLKDLNQILGYLNHFYFDNVDLGKVMDGAFFGLMEELDPHST